MCCRVSGFLRHQRLNPPTRFSLLLLVCRSAEERDVREHGDAAHAPRPDAGTPVQRYHGDGGRRAAEQPDDGGSDRYGERRRRKSGRRKGRKGILYLNLFLVPAAVSNFTAAHSNSTSFSLSWQQPEGDLDALVVSLPTNGTSRWETTLPPDATEVAVDQLTPGSAYQVVVTSRSGELTNQSEITVRTGETSFSFSFVSSSSLFFIPSLSCLQLRRRRPCSPSPPPPPVASSCPGRPPRVAGRTTNCSCLTAPSS